MSTDSLQRLAPVGVSLLIALLAYGSQILFPYVEPYALERGQAVKFNVWVACIWVCYYRACTLDPGRVPAGWRPGLLEGEDGQDGREVEGKVRQSEEDRKEHHEDGDGKGALRSRWCKKCEAFKAPRSHHCRICQRCIPKMDHHCPWTVNCVSHRTLPSFMRFLFYATLSMTYLAYLYFQRLSILWSNRKLPSYLGPSPTALAALFLLSTTNVITLILVGITLIHSVHNLAVNTTTIEGWEIDRHEVLLRQAKVNRGYLDGPEGTRIKIRRQEFPYDIGIWKNLKQGMDGGFLTWLWPFKAAPLIESGMSWEVNGFEDPSISWPPPDPDRMTRVQRPGDSGPAFTFADAAQEDSARIAAFRVRQEADLARSRGSPVPRRRNPYHANEEDEGYGSQTQEANEEAYGNDFAEDDEDSEDERGHVVIEPQESWRNAEGERLADFGLDEDAEFYDDDVPLSVLIERRKAGNGLSKES